MRESALPRFTRSRPVRRVLLGLVLGVTLLALPSPATAASTLEPLWEAQAGGCSFSWQDSTTDSGVAYGIVESPAESNVSCELTLSDASRRIIATVAVANGPGVIYVTAPGDYTYTLIDQNLNADAIGAVTLSGIPNLNQPGIGSATDAGCVRSLEKRSIPGHLATYTTGWNIVTSASSSTCSSGVGGSRSPYYLGSASEVRTQVALLDPYGITLTKSATHNGTVVTSANVGDQIVYQFTVANTGLIPWTVTVTDPLPGVGAVSCPAATLSPGDVVTCTAPYSVTDSDLTLGSVANTATATGIDNVRFNATDASTKSEPASTSFTVSGAAPSATQGLSPSPAHPYYPSEIPAPSSQAEELAATGGNWPSAGIVFGIGLSAVGFAALRAARRRGRARSKLNPPARRTLSGSQPTT